MRHKAKLFLNGRSQAVRLPSEFRFDSKEVYISRDPDSGDIVLSRKPGSWDDFFNLIKTSKVSASFMSDREDAPPQKRKLF